LPYVRSYYLKLSLLKINGYNIAMEKIILTWSGGKDSALSLYHLQRSGLFEISSILTTITDRFDRVCMHGVRSTLLEEQARSLGLHLQKIHLSSGSSIEEYDIRMRKALVASKRSGISAVAFGDIFLEDLKRYREKRLSSLQIKGVFPLWGRDTAELAKDFIDLGFKAVITCVDSKALDKRFVGRLFNKTLLSELPAGVDPCGENGEFHSFVYDGPIFKKNIDYISGETVCREGGFYFRDLALSTSVKA